MPATARHIPDSDALCTPRCPGASLRRATQMHCANRAALVPVWGVRVRVHCAHRASACVGACLRCVAPDALCTPRCPGACARCAAPGALKLCKPRCIGACLGRAGGSRCVVRTGLCRCLLFLVGTVDIAQIATGGFGSAQIALRAPTHAHHGNRNLRTAELWGCAWRGYQQGTKRRTRHLCYSEVQLSNFT